MNITTEAVAITAVAIQPTYFKYPRISNRPMMLLFAVISIMTVITGAATTPLMTALQNSAFIGAIDEKLIPSSDKSRDNDRCIKRFGLLWFPRKANLPPTCFRQGISGGPSKNWNQQAVQFPQFPMQILRKQNRQR